MCNCKKTKTATRSVSKVKKVSAKTLTQGGKKYRIKPKR